MTKQRWAKASSPNVKTQVHVLNASLRRIDLVARSRQVCIYVVEALLIAIYLGNGLILVDIRKPSAERLSRPI